MLKRKTYKMESYSEACIFRDYPKGMSGSIFYSPKDNQVFINKMKLS